MIYEVNILVDNQVAEQMATWLGPHIREILEFDGFTSATWYQLDAEAGRQSWSIQYRVENYHQLNEYLEKHAPRMREEGLARFGGRFAATRRILAERATFSRSRP